MTRSAVADPTSPTATMRPPSMCTSPDSTSSELFMVRTVALRIRSDTAVGVPCVPSGSLRSFDPGHPFQRRGSDLLLFASSDSDQLRDDGDGNFLRSHGANVETNGCVHFFEPLDRYGSVLNEHVVQPLDLGAAADQSQIAEILDRQSTQRVEIVPMPASDDHRISGARQSRLRKPGRDIFNDNLRRIRKALAIRELLAIVDHM